MREKNGPLAARSFQQAYSAVTACRGERRGGRSRAALAELRFFRGMLRVESALLTVLTLRDMLAKWVLCGVLTTLIVCASYEIQRHDH